MVDIQNCPNTKASAAGVIRPWIGLIPNAVAKNTVAEIRVTDCTYTGLAALVTVANPTGIRHNIGLIASISRIALMRLKGMSGPGTLCSAYGAKLSLRPGLQ